jgi:hypothetical protein
LTTLNVTAAGTELTVFVALTRARARLGGAYAARPARSAWSVQRQLAARFDGEVAGGADSTLVIFRFGATMELGRSGAIDDDDDVGFGDGGVAGSLS